MRNSSHPITNKQKLSFTFNGKKYFGFKGDINPWTVSKDSPEFIRGHMQKYDPRSILGKEKASLGEYGHERARKVLETSVSGSNHMSIVFGGHRSEYGHSSDRV